MHKNWKAGEEQGLWAGELEQEAWRLARAIKRLIGIAWRDGYKLIYLPSHDAEATVSPSGEVTWLRPQTY